jgi:hypothetical protein
MKRTLLEMVQSIINDMDGDEVSTITETFEAEQVAILVREAYFSLIDSRNWPHLKQLLAVTESDATSPSTILIPDPVKELVDLRFNKQVDGETRRRYQKVKYLYPDEFLDMINERNNDNANIEIVTTPANVELLIRNDRHPEYWTSFSDTSITFDSYDSAQYTFVPATSIQCYGYVTPTWTASDTFVPDLPEEAFSLLLEEAKSAAFYTMKNMVNEKAESRAQRADAWLSRKAWVSKGGVRYPNYGRKAKGYGSRRPHPLEKYD